jgi:hypothetical protein
MTGCISCDTAIHGTPGPHCFTAGWDVPDGAYWAAARATDNLGDTDVQVWLVERVPCYPED